MVDLAVWTWLQCLGPVTLTTSQFSWLAQFNQCNNMCVNDHFSIIVMVYQSTVVVVVIIALLSFLFVCLPVVYCTSHHLKTHAPQKESYLELWLSLVCKDSVEPCRRWCCPRQIIGISLTPVNRDHGYQVSNLEPRHLADACVGTLIDRKL